VNGGDDQSWPSVESAADVSYIYFILSKHDTSKGQLMEDNINNKQ